jgi:hypothetical protein
MLPVLGGIKAINMSSSCFAFPMHISGYTLHILINQHPNQPTNQPTNQPANQPTNQTTH